jgi:dTDP-4-dehydrorhamnose 3,5-epimerase
MSQPQTIIQVTPVILCGGSGTRLWPLSRNFGKWVGVELSADNKRQLWVPPGFAHGFVVTSESAEFLYKTTDYWYPEHERSLVWCDPTVGVQWPSGSLRVFGSVKEYWWDCDSWG